jgi:hypothetical protein
MHSKADLLIPSETVVNPLGKTKYLKQAANKNYI